MASPIVQEAIESSTNTAGTSHVVTLPTATAGQLLLIILDKGSTSATINAHASLTELLDEASANGLYIAYRWMDGTEPASYTLISSASTRSARIAYRISGAENPATTAPQIGTTGTGTSATPDPPASAAPPSSKDYLFVAFFGQAGEEADDDTWVNTPPTNYTPSPPRQKACGTVGTNLGGKIGAAERALTTGSAENPGTFGVDVSAAWRAQTITIHPYTPTFADIRQDIINGIDSAQSEANGWDAEVKAKLPVTAVVRTSNTVVTITLSAAAAYDITAQETIEATIPASALVGGTLIVATPTFTVDEVVAEQYYGTASISSNGLIEGKIQKGGIGYIWAQAAGILLSVGVAGMLAAASIFGGGSLNVAAQKAISADVVVSGAGSVIAEGHLVGEEYFGTALISGNGEVLSEGGKNVGESSIVSSDGLIISEGKKSASSIIPISANGSIISGGTKQGTSSVSTMGNGSIIGTGLKAGKGIVLISEDGTIQETGIKQVIGDSTLTGSGSLVVLGIPGGMEEYFGSAIIPGGGEILGIGEKIGEGIALISGNGSLSASGILGYPEEHSGSAIISGNGIIQETGTKQGIGDSIITGNGSLDVSGIIGYPEQYSGSAFISDNGSIVISSRTKINRKQPILRMSIPASAYSTIMKSQDEMLSGSFVSKKETQVSIPIMVSSGGKSLESFIFIKIDPPLGEMIAKKDEEE